MPLNLQAKILRLLQEKSIERLGGSENINADVRIIAATNRDLESAILDGRFREDLYYRLKVVTIWLPPLRERESDIPLLTDYFLSKFSDEKGINNPGITEKAKAVFSKHSWPGNVRELANTIQKALIFNRGAPISSDDIAKAISEELHETDLNSESGDQALLLWLRKELTTRRDENLFDSCMDNIASILISEALSICEGNRSKAAKLLGLSRPTLHSKIEKYHLKFETLVKENNS
jgi:DNA-binding NtrC family response regulator